MKVLGIVCEYNPFHNGHKYLIDEAKRKTGADIVIAIMSGNFTQQGNIAIYDKYKRADFAVQNGIDIVIELPTIFAVSSAEYFSMCSIKILNSLNVVDYIAFGTECDDINILNEVSRKMIINDKEIVRETNKLLKEGMSFAKAKDKAVQNILTKEEMSQIRKPNNILAIEYIKALSKNNSSIIPVSIKREGAEYNSSNILPYNFSSATAIRNHIYKNLDVNVLRDAIPENIFGSITSLKYLSNDSIFYLLKYKILSLGSLNLKNINEINEGLENKILSCISLCDSYSTLVSNIKSKRYKESRIRRTLINILLNITKDDFKEAKSKDSYYAHILDVSQNGKNYLSVLSKNSKIPIIIKKKDINKITDTILSKMINYDIFASNIYSILNNDEIYKDYTNKI